MSGHGKKLVQTKLFAGKNTVGFLKTCEYIGLLPVLFQVLDPVGLLLDLLLLIRPHKLIQKGGFGVWIPFLVRNQAYLFVGKLPNFGRLPPPFCCLKTFLGCPGNFIKLDPPFLKILYAPYGPRLWSDFESVRVCVGGLIPQPTSLADPEFSKRGAQPYDLPENPYYKPNFRWQKG